MIDEPRKKTIGARVALAHDWLVGLRGGEWVLDRLARLFGPTDLYTLVDNGAALTEAIRRCRVITSPLQRLPGAAGRLRRHYLPLMPWAVERLAVQPCDVLISTSSAVMKSIIPPEGVPHLCYCHSPARYVWEQSADYATGSGGGLRSFGLRAISSRFKRWDRRTAARVTRFLANSEHTARRIERCFDRDAAVVYPPVRTEFFTSARSTPREAWFLVVAALEPYKRTDLVVEAANRAGIPLKVVGDGSQATALAAAAGPTVEMLGRVDDETLRDLYRRARALVFPQLEDFGIIAAEAQACGCPVIGCAEGGGGATEIVTDETGLLFPRRTSESLLEAILEFETRDFSRTACRRNAERFSERVFDDAILAHVGELYDGASDGCA